MGKKTQRKTEKIAMTQQFTNRQRRVTRLLVVLLAIFLSGANSVFCCGQSVLAKTPPAAEHCATTAGNAVTDGDCCAEKSPEPVESSTAPCDDECCILSAPLAELPGGISVGRFVRALPAASAYLPVGESAPNAAPRFQPTFLLQKRETYLQCCVLLI